MKRRSCIRSSAHHPPPAARLPVLPPHSLLLEGAIMDPAGNLYVTDGARGLVLRVTPAGVVVPLVGLGALSAPTGLAFGAEGSLYLSDSGKHQVLKLGDLLPLSEGRCCEQAHGKGDRGASDRRAGHSLLLGLRTEGGAYALRVANSIRGTVVYSPL